MRDESNRQLHSGLASLHSPNFWLATGERRQIFDTTGLQPAITPYRDLEVRRLLVYPLLAADSALFFGSLASSIITHHQPSASRISPAEMLAHGAVEMVLRGCT